MTFRSSSSLVRMVEAAKELTEHASVLKRIDAVLRITGVDRTYGKGRPLVEALERVAQEAILCGDFGLAQRFQRFAGYADGELFLEVVEGYYDERARQRSEEFMRRMAALGADRAAAVLDVLCRDDPDATAADARDVFRGIARSADHLGSKPARAGSGCPLGK
ncbi:hypothetical protein [Kitasatospora purpeofusca]|uniref:hypothetical protein n=1 Tax=Kitasatospora purpeofusca TaxID=67352 RepID=UPI00386E17FF